MDLNWALIMVSNGSHDSLGVTFKDDLSKAQLLCKGRTKLSCFGLNLKSTKWIWKKFAKSTHNLPFVIPNHHPDPTVTTIFKYSSINVDFVVVKMRWSP